MSQRDRNIHMGRLSDQGQENDLRDTTPEERIAMMWQLAVDAYAMRGVHVNESEFPRHVDGIIRGKR